MQTSRRGPQYRRCVSTETRPPVTLSSPRLPSAARTSRRSLRRQHRFALLQLHCPSRPCHCCREPATPTSSTLEEPFSHNWQDESLDRASPSTSADGRTPSSIPETIDGERAKRSLMPFLQTITSGKSKHG